MHSNYTFNFILFCGVGPYLVVFGKQCGVVRLQLSSSTCKANILQSSAARIFKFFLLTVGTKCFPHKKISFMSLRIYREMFSWVFIILKTTLNSRKLGPFKFWYNYCLSIIKWSHLQDVLSGLSEKKKGN